MGYKIYFKGSSCIIPGFKIALKPGAPTYQDIPIEQGGSWALDDGDVLIFEPTQVYSGYPQIAVTLQSGCISNIFHIDAYGHTIQSIYSVFSENDSLFRNPDEEFLRIYKISDEFDYDSLSIWDEQESMQYGRLIAVAKYTIVNGVPVWTWVNE